jgi:hypothetical protein
MRPERALWDHLRPGGRSGGLPGAQRGRDEVPVAADAAAEQPARAHAQPERAEDLLQLRLLAEGLHLERGVEMISFETCFVPADPS